MKRMLLALALLCTCASAQGALLSIPAVMTTSEIGSVTVTVPAANVSVQVCTSNGAGIPCTPVASLYQNQALTTPASNPGITNTQGVPLFSGFPTVYVQPGIYIISETGSAITGGNVTLQASCVGVGTCTLTRATIGSLTAISPAITPTSVGGVSLGLAGGAITDISTKGPWIDPRAYGASSSDETTTATCAASSATVTVANALDFANGQGIALSACGPAAFGGTAITPPTPTVINWCGQSGQMACTSAPGSTTYNYKIVVDDGAEGYTAAGAPGTTTTGAATLGPACCNTASGANYLTWSAPSGITTDRYGYFVYAQANGGSWRLIGLASIPGDAIPWASSTYYPNGSYVTPLAAPNGSYYVAVTGGKSGSTEPSWCTSSATCAVADGSVTWQRQPFTWMDTGQTVNFQPGWVPSTPPASGEADVLVSSIASGAGTTTLTLSGPASTSASGALAQHDDTAALAAALTAQHNACIADAPAGQANASACPQIIFAPGTYNISSPLTVASGTNILGRANGWVDAQEPFQPIFSGTPTTLNINGLYSRGGLDVLYAPEVGSDNSLYTITGLVARYTTDFAVSVGTQEYLGEGALGGSVTLSGDFGWDRAVLYCGTDYCNVEPSTWVETSFSNDEPYRAEFVNANHLGIHGMVGVPFGLPYDRWVDNWGGSVVIDQNTRLGAENGGIAPVYQLGGYGAAQAFDWTLPYGALGSPTEYLGGTVTIRDSQSSDGAFQGRGGGVIVSLNNSWPQGLTVKATRNLFNSGLLNTCATSNALTCALPAGYTASNLDTLYEGTLGQYGAIATRMLDVGGTSGPDQFCAAGAVDGNVLPAEVSDGCRFASASPTSGMWGTSPLFVRSSSTTAGSASGWMLGSWGRAAPAWQASHTYTLATSPTGEGDDFVAATVAGTAYNFYVSGVSSGSTCTSGASVPSWSTSFNATTGAGSTTPDGTCTWTVETYGSITEGQVGYVAPYATVPAAQFTALGALQNSTLYSPNAAPVTVSGTSSSAPVALSLCYYGSPNCSNAYVPAAAGQFWTGSTAGDLGLVAGENLWLGANGNARLGVEITTDGRLHAPSTNIGVTTVSSLPSAATAGSGAIYVVTDGNGTAGACTGGGSVIMLAISNGSSWTCR